MNTIRKVSEKGGCWAKDLTDEQKEFAKAAIERLAKSNNLLDHSDDFGAVKALTGNRKGEYVYKPSRHLRNVCDMEIRVIFKPYNLGMAIFIIRVASRAEVYF